MDLGYRAALIESFLGERTQSYGVEMTLLPWRYRRQSKITPLRLAASLNAKIVSLACRSLLPGLLIAPLIYATEAAC